MPRFTLRVNGESHEVEAPPDMPLLWVLRDLVGLTGTKYGCGIARCGACTVHVDGRAVPSCATPVSSVGDAEVTTIEGLDSEAGRAVKEAWIAEDVPQCGFCQPGQVMAAADLLARSSDPDDDEIDRAMAGNLCRCGTYGRIRKAVHRAASAGASGRRADGEG